MQTLTIIRGLPGSGKSTLGLKVARKQNAIIACADDYFIDFKTREYKFDPSKLGEAHAFSQKRAKLALEAGHNCVVTNTSIHRWEMKPYVELGQKFDCYIIIMEPYTDWAWDHQECFKKCTHGVPLETIKRMHLEFETFIDTNHILAAKAPWE